MSPQNSEQNSQHTTHNMGLAMAAMKMWNFLTCLGILPQFYQPLRLPPPQTKHTHNMGSAMATMEMWNFPMVLSTKKLA
jgi:hypothetical protein